MSKKILLIGRNGQVGFELSRSLSLLGDIVSFDYPECDMSSAANVQAILDKTAPDIIVNASAYTAVDKAESDVDAARAVNAQGVGVLAKYAAAHGVLLIHYSTDYVYDGNKAGAYVETDPTGPASVYGLTKLEGDEAIAAAGPAYAVLRTSWVFGAHGGNFLKTMLKLMQERDALRVVADQVGAPTSAALIADVTAHVVAQYLRSTADFPSGVYHLVAGGETSWHGYAQFVGQTALELGYTLKLDPAKIEAIGTKDYPVPAPRPANSRLDTGKLCKTFGLDLPDWTIGAKHVMRQLAGK